MQGQRQPAGWTKPREKRAEMTTQTLQDSWIKRADEVLNGPHGGSAGEAIQCATSMIAAFYGPESAQMKAFRASMDAIAKEREGQQHKQAQNARGVIRNIKAEISAGLIRSVRALLTGEMLGDLVGLSREILSESQDAEASKNMGAVLAACAFEDLLRRMGTEFAGITNRPKLEKVINILKETDVLRGGEPAIVQGHLKFRNDSLHADWNQIQRSQVDSCLALVEALVSKHFS
jgi:hypothetical protein